MLSLKGDTRDAGDRPGPGGGKTSATTLSYGLVEPRVGAPAVGYILEQVLP